MTSLEETLIQLELLADDRSILWIPCDTGFDTANFTFLTIKYRDEIFDITAAGPGGEGLVYAVVERDENDPYVFEFEVRDDETGQLGQESRRPYQFTDAERREYLFSDDLDNPGRRIFLLDDDDRDTSERRVIFRDDDDRETSERRVIFRDDDGQDTAETRVVLYIED